jgi:type I restriction enzyme R subunit
VNPSAVTEDELVERPAMELLERLGWTGINAYEETMGPSGTLGRGSQGELVLRPRLAEALRKLNPEAPEAALDLAAEQLVKKRSTMNPVRANREVYNLLRDGASVAVEGDDEQKTLSVRFVDWTSTEANDWLAVSQLWIQGEMYKRRADIVLFVNGIPLVLMELKVSHKNVRDAYDKNLTDYRDTIGDLFRFNAFVLLSNGSDTRVGSTYAPWGHFAEWKRINSEGEEGVVSLETALRGTCEPARLLDLVENFVAYTEMPGGLVKPLAKNHQFLGVNSALEALDELDQREGRLGVFWHTQGAGKSLSMLWLTQKVLRKKPGNWTFVLVTDRRELDEQLHHTFADSGAITSGQAVHAETSAHLRQLLGSDHRYVFTLIHKFIPPEQGAPMPELSDRSDIVVITDEAHRSQYDTLAANMRLALPNAAFLGFTGTPLIAGEEEETRRVFGDYVSIYNFRDSISDGATVPLYYENRIPELQLTNADFDQELEEVLEAAELDDAQEKAVARRFSQQYQLITRPQRLAEIARDLVDHFFNRGFRGKGMYVAIDKATAVRMYDLVQLERDRYLAELVAKLETTPELERSHLESLVEYVRETDMAVVVSQAQNEIADLAAFGLDIGPHRKRMQSENLDSKFKDPEDRFRLVFVCAMWMTGFDAPATSTVYLDKPMRNHSLMQTIARANRVFPDKENGLIVDYIGVFRNLEKALSIYGTDRSGAVVDSPIRPKEELAAELSAALEHTAEFCAAHDIDLDDLDRADGFEFVALQKAAVEALLIDEETRRTYVSLARDVRKAFKVLLPDPGALAATHRVAVIRSIASKIESLDEAPDIRGVMDSVSELLDRSVGAKEYVIRTAADADPLLDLNALDFEQLALRFAANKRTAAKAAEKSLEQRLNRAVLKNPTRIDLAERFRQLIDEYNAGAHNLEEFFRRLKVIHDDLSEQEQRLVREDLTEAEMALFDLLTKPEPELSETELEQVRGAAKTLLAHVEEKLVLDWRRRQQTRSAVRVVVGTVLDAELPDVYGPDLFDQKVEAIYEHIYGSYFDDGHSVYADSAMGEDVGPTEAPTLQVNPDEMSEQLLSSLQTNPELFSRFMEAAFGANETWACPIEELLSTSESRVVEYKQTARWNVNEGRRDKAMELIVVKTIAGLLNDRGGTLLIGVTDERKAVGLETDFAQVTPSNADGYVNWLDTLFETHLGHAGANRLQIRIERVSDHDICRVDVPASSRPIFVKSKHGDEVLYQRRSNSTREVPPDEIDGFLAERFPTRVPAAP